LSEETEYWQNEPSKNFINYIIRNLSEIQHLLFHRDQPGLAIPAMRGLISSLDPYSKEKLKPIYDDLWKWHDNIRVVNRRMIEEAYYKLVDYLHTTYLRGVTKGIIPSSFLPGKREAPEAKKYAKQLSEDVA